MADTARLDTFLARELSQRADHVVHAWIERVSARVAVRPRDVFPAETLRERLPDVVRSLAEKLDEEDAVLDADTVGRLRAIIDHRREQGYDVQEVLKEIELLGEVLFETVEDALEGYDGPTAAAFAPVACRLHRHLSAIGTITGGTYREAERRREREEAEALETFGRTLAHEMKNPIGAARGGAEMLLDDAIAGDPAKRRQFAELVVRNLDRARELVDDVRDLVRGREPAEQRNRPLSEVIGDAVAEAAPLSERRSVRIDVEEPVPEAEVDASRTELILVNLITNAIKYCNPDEPSPHVRIEAERQGREVAIRVRDNGLGIPEDLHDRVFERFFRAHPDADAGTGLGLAITREAVAQLGGEIAFDSRAGEGTTFRIRLPLSAPTARHPDE